MSRFLLAFSCFFRLLFSGKLPSDAAVYLPPSALPEPPALPPPPAPVEKPVIASAAVPRKKESNRASEELGALALLSLLQREGRLIDFLRESLDTYSDSDIGAAVRDVHRGCQKILERHFTLEAVMPGKEDESVKLPEDITQVFGAGNVRIVGERKSNVSGVLRHHGWRATKVELPLISEGIDRRVLAPAEVEFGSPQ